jgi:hypothetical protein
VGQNWPHHVIQRGHNKRVVFRSTADARRQRAGSDKRDAVGRAVCVESDRDGGLLAGLWAVRGAQSGPGADGVKRPEPYRWSSSRARAGLSAWTWLDRDPLSRFFPHAFMSPPQMTDQADFVTA